jgi:hypothetical protein
MSEPDYKKLAKQAADAVEGLKEPAFSIAFGKILEDLISRERHQVRTEAGRAVASVTKSATGLGGNEGDPVDLFNTRPVDAADYAELFRSNGKLVMKCLAVLKLARDEFGIDGLGPASLESILKKKFRVAGVHPGNISRDLGKSLKFVSRVDRGGKAVYILTAQGEESLKLAISNQSMN